MERRRRREQKPGAGPIQRRGLFVWFGVLLWLPAAAIGVLWLLGSTGNDDGELLMILAGPSVSVGVVGAMIVQPWRLAWWRYALALVWLAPWGFTARGIFWVVESLDNLLEGWGWIPEAGGMMGRLGMHLMAMILLSALISAVVLAFALRSRFVTAIAFAAVVIIPSGLVAEEDALRYTIGTWPLLIAGAALGWAVRERLKVREPWQCAKCRYDLRGLGAEACPECGRAVEPGSPGVSAARG